MCMMFIAVPACRKSRETIPATEMLSVSWTIGAVATNRVLCSFGSPSMQSLCLCTVQLAEAHALNSPTRGLNTARAGAQCAHGLHRASGCCLKQRRHSCRREIGTNEAPSGHLWPIFRLPSTEQHAWLTCCCAQCVAAAVKALPALPAGSSTIQFCRRPPGAHWLDAARCAQQMKSNPAHVSPHGTGCVSSRPKYILTAAGASTVSAE